jgi:hypothetical protein
MLGFVRRLLLITFLQAHTCFCVAPIRGMSAQSMKAS